ncbi:MFS general substrate transporter [Melanogaster broomeanus]|nr:MFS general substrate transporter [Melanogaster broomeanus]
MSSILHTSSDNPLQSELDSGTTSQKSQVCGSEEQLELPAAPSLVLPAEQEANLWRKMDLHLIPIISVVALLIHTWREGAIGNAKIEGMTTQLDLTGNRYNLVLQARHQTFYLIHRRLFRLIVFLMFHQISYFKLYDRPGKCIPNVVLSSNPYTRWLPTIMVVWGTITTVMGFVTTYPQLLGARLCLGAADAGLSPGIAYYLTLWYPRYKFQYRISIFAAAGSLAGAFSGLIAYALGAINGIGGLETWSWIFILDGLATVVVALIAYFVMVDYPSTARFLTAEERSFVIETQEHRAARDEEQGAVPQIIAAFTDWQVWALSVVHFSVSAPASGLGYFLPTIINDFGYSTSTTQLLTIPPHLLSAAAHVAIAYFSDKARLRSPFIFAGQLISLVGFVINISGASSSVKYFGLFLCSMGSATGPGVTAWLANNLGGKYKRATGIAIEAMVSNIGGAIASNIFRSQDAPRYLLGLELEIAFICMGLTVIPIMAFTYQRINSARDREELLQQQKGEKEKPKEGARPIGDRVLNFRYDVVFVHAEKGQLRNTAQVWALVVVIISERMHAPEQERKSNVAADDDMLANNLRGKYNRPYRIDAANGNAGRAIATNIFRSHDKLPLIFGSRSSLVFPFHVSNLAIFLVSLEIIL